MCGADDRGDNLSAMWRRCCALRASYDDADALIAGEIASTMARAPIATRADARAKTALLRQLVERNADPADIEAAIASLETFLERCADRCGIMSA